MAADPLKLIFAGTPDFAASVLQALLTHGHEVCAAYTQPDRPAGRGRHLKASPVKALAMHYDIPLCQPATLRTAQAQAELRAWAADVMVVVAYGLILPSALLDAPRYGCVNVHASLLPRWRGAAPIQRAILAGDTQTGITIIQMDAGLDTGASLAEAPCPILPDDTALTLHDRLMELGARTLLPVLDQLRDGTLHPTPQDHARACYAHKLSKDEARLDWRRSAAELERQVRAFNPWPVARTVLGEIPVQVWSAQALPDAVTAVPGTLLAVERHGVEVACGTGVLRLTRLQLPGGRALPVAELLNAQRGVFNVGACCTLPSSP